MAMEGVGKTTADAHAAMARWMTTKNATTATPNLMTAAIGAATSSNCARALDQLPRGWDWAFELGPPLRTQVTNAKSSMVSQCVKLRGFPDPRAWRYYGRMGIEPGNSGSSFASGRGSREEGGDAWNALRQLGSPHDSPDEIAVRRARGLLGWGVVSAGVAWAAAEPVLRAGSLRAVTNGVVTFRLSLGSRTTGSEGLGMPLPTSSFEVSSVLLLGLAACFVAFYFYACRRLLLALRCSTRTRVVYLGLVLVPGINLLALLGLYRLANEALRFR